MNRDFHFDSPIPTRRTHLMASLCKGLAGSGPRCFQRSREGPVSHLAGTPRPEMTLFPSASADTSPATPASSSKSAVLCTRPIPPAPAAPQSSSACLRRAGASDDSPQAATSSSASWYPLRASSLMCWGGNSGLVDSRESQKNHERLGAIYSVARNRRPFVPRLATAGHSQPVTAG